MVRFNSRVSSVLNNDTKNYGGKLMFNDDEETCWNSSEGSPQWIEINFEEAKLISGIEIQFQGGFVGQQCQILAYENRPNADTKPIVEMNDFYPEDTNELQTYTLKDPLNAKFLRIIFHESTDFYGRVTIYKLKIV